MRKSCGRKQLTQRQTPAVLLHSLSIVCTRAFPRRILDVSAAPLSIEHYPCTFFRWPCTRQKRHLVTIAFHFLPTDSIRHLSGLFAAPSTRLPFSAIVKIPQAQPHAMACASLHRNLSLPPAQSHAFPRLGVPKTPRHPTLFLTSHLGLLDLIYEVSDIASST